MEPTAGKQYDPKTRQLNRLTHMLERELTRLEIFRSDFHNHGGDYSRIWRQLDKCITLRASIAEFARAAAAA